MAAARLGFPARNGNVDLKSVLDRRVGEHKLVHGEVFSDCVDSGDSFKNAAQRRGLEAEYLNIEVFWLESAKAVPNAPPNEHRASADVSNSLADFNYFAIHS